MTTADTSQKTTPNIVFSSDLEEAFFNFQRWLRPNNTGENGLVTYFFENNGFERYGNISFWMEWFNGLLFTTQPLADANSETNRYMILMILGLVWVSSLFVITLLVLLPWSVLTSHPHSPYTPSCRKCRKRYRYSNSNSNATAVIITTGRTTTTTITNSNADAATFDYDNNYESSHSRCTYQTYLASNESVLSSKCFSLKCVLTGLKRRLFCTSSIREHRQYQNRGTDINHVDNVILQERNSEGVLGRRPDHQNLHTQAARTTSPTCIIEDQSTRCIKLTPRTNWPAVRLGFLQLTVILLAFATFGLLIYTCVLNGPIHSWAKTTSSSQSHDANKTPPSIGLVVNQSIRDIDSFLKIGIAKGNSSSLVLLSDIEQTVRNVTRKGIWLFVEKFMHSYGLDAVFKNSRILSVDIIALSGAMSYIFRNAQSTFMKLHEFEGRLTLMQSKIDHLLGPMCSYQYPADIADWARECRELKDKLSQIRMPIDQTKVNVDSSTHIIFATDRFKINLVNISADLIDKEAKLNNVLEESMGKLEDKISFKFDMTDSILALWNEMAVLHFNFLNTTANSEDTVDQYVSESYRIHSIVFGVITALMMLIVIIYLIFIVRLILFRSYLWRKPILKENEHKIQLNNEGNGTEGNNPDISMINSPITTRILTFVVLFGGLISILPAAQSLGYLVTGSVVRTEVCSSFETQKSVALTDRRLDVFLAEMWPIWLEKILPKKKKKPGTQFQIPIPSRALTGLMYECRKPKMGLLTALNIHGLINVSAYLNSEGFTKIVDTGEAMAIEETVKINFQSLIGKNLKNLLNQSLILTKYFDSVEYQSSIDALSRSVIELPDYETFRIKLSSFANKINRHPMYHSFETIILNDFVAKLSSDIEKSVNDNQQLVDTLADHYRTLQNKRQFTPKVNFLLQAVLFLESILNDKVKKHAVTASAYSQVKDYLKEKITKRMNSLLSQWEHELAPCQSLERAFTQFRDSVCARGRFAGVVGGFSFSQIITALLFQCLVVCMWVLVRKVRWKLLERHVSKC